MEIMDVTQIDCHSVLLPSASLEGNAHIQEREAIECNVLECFLPKSHKYEVRKFDVGEHQSQFSCEIRAALENVNDVNSWMSEFQSLTNTKYNLRQSKSCTEKSQHPVSRGYECHHSSYGKVSGSYKDKECRAKITISIKKDTVSVRRSDSFVGSGLRAIIIIHNHLTNNAGALKWLPRTDSTKDAFLEYFKKGDCHWHSYYWKPPYVMYF